MIGIVSAGFNPPSSLTLEEIEFLRKCEHIIVDTFTSPFYMKAFEGKNLTFAERERLEDFSWIFDLSGNVGIVISGDSFSATTHFNIYKESLKLNREVRVFHNATIVPIAATRFGLHLYKIGPIISLPRFSDKFRPTSPYLKIMENVKNGLHSIILLDTNPPMDLNEALDELLWLEKEMKQGLFSDETKLGIVSSLGMQNEKIVYGKIKQISSLTATPPITIILPGELHFQEKENLSLFELFY